MDEYEVTLTVEFWDYMDDGNFDEELYIDNCLKWVGDGSGYIDSLKNGRIEIRGAGQMLIVVTTAVFAFTVPKADFDNGAYLDDANDFLESFHYDEYKIVETFTRKKEKQNETFTE